MCVIPCASGTGFARTVYKSRKQYTKQEDNIQKKKTTYKRRRQYTKQEDNIQKQKTTYTTRRQYTNHQHNMIYKKTIQYTNLRSTLWCARQNAFGRTLVSQCSQHLYMRHDSCMRHSPTTLVSQCSQHLYINGT
jgi:hypothetical protein